MYIVYFILCILFLAVYKGYKFQLPNRPLQQGLYFLLLPSVYSQYGPYFITKTNPRNLLLLNVNHFIWTEYFLLQGVNEKLCTISSCHKERQISISIITDSILILMAPMWVISHYKYKYSIWYDKCPFNSNDKLVLSFYPFPDVSLVLQPLSTFLLSPSGSPQVQPFPLAHTM